MMKPDTRALWGSRHYRRLIVARTVSNIGNGIAPIALGALLTVVAMWWMYWTIDWCSSSRSLFSSSTKLS